MKIQKTILKARKKLLEKNIEDGNLIAIKLLCHILQQDRQYLIIHQNDEVLQKDDDIFQKQIEAIIQGQPLQYLIGHQEFMGFDFLVNQHVLIPQPDTEVVVENCLNICKKYLKKNQTISVLDLCTGSGAIAISIDKLLQGYEKKKIVGSDISQEALSVAQENNMKNYTQVQWIQSDLFQNLSESFNVIVSNPPYIETSVISTLSKEVQAEPLIALDGGKDGLEFYRRIANEAVNYLQPDGYLCLEIGYHQAKEVEKILQNKYKNIQVIKDFAQNDRCVICQKRKEEECHFQEKSRKN